MEPITINATDLRTKTRDLMERVKFHGEWFVIETFKRPMAVLISYEDFERIKEELATRRAAQSPERPAPLEIKGDTAHRRKSKAGQAETR